MKKCSYVHWKDDVMGLNQENIEVHEDIVKRVQDKQPDDEYLYELADLFKVFGDTTRIKILYALFESELCVGDIALVLGNEGKGVHENIKELCDEVINIKMDKACESLNVGVAGSILMYEVYNGRINNSR